MKIDDIYKYAGIFENASKVIFWLVILLSIFLLVQETGIIGEIAKIILVILTISGTVVSILIRNLQVDGNRDRRKSQLRNDLNYLIGEEAKPGYYNSSTQPSLKSLGVTTLENTKFTIAILEKMILGKRLVSSLYIIMGTSKNSLKDEIIGTR